MLANTIHMWLIAWHRSDLNSFWTNKLVSLHDSGPILKLKRANYMMLAQLK
jgi:hypothetical protein